MLNVIRKKEEPVRGVATVTYFAEAKSAVVPKNWTMC